MKKVVWTDGEGCEHEITCSNPQELADAKAEIVSLGVRFKVRPCTNGHSGRHCRRDQACRRLSRNHSPQTACSAL